MFTQDVMIPNGDGFLSTTVAVAGANVYAELLAIPEVADAMPETITREMFDTPIRNASLKALCESHLNGAKKKVWLKGLFAVAFAIQEGEVA